MIMNIYSIKDVVSGSFGNLVLQANDQLAIRTFKGICQDSKIAKDLQLFKMGSFNVEEGKIESKVEFLIGGEDA